MAEEGQIKVRVLMFPLDSHPGALEQCVSVICDNKGFGDLHGGYRSENQCEEGTKLVADTVDFLRSKGVSSTPTYIFPDGLPRPGLLQEDALRERLGIGGKEAPQNP